MLSAVSANRVKAHFIVFFSLHFMLVCNFWKGKLVSREPHRRGHDQICCRTILADCTDAAWCHREMYSSACTVHDTHTHTHTHAAAADVSGNREFTYATDSQPWHTFTSACTPSHSLPPPPPSHPHDTLHWLKRPPLPSPTFKSKFPFAARSAECCCLLCTQKFAEAVSCPQTSAPWSGAGEERQGLGLVCMLLRVDLSECVMYGFVYVCVCARVSEQLFK